MINELVKIHSGTCIRFVWRSNEANYIEMFRGNGCWSNLGRQGEKRMIFEDHLDGIQEKPT